MTHESLEKLFSSEQELFPTVISQNSEDNEANLNLFVPVHLHYFKGHFNGNPVLPGVVQTHWAVHYGKKIFSFSDNFIRLEAIKFQRVLKPQLKVTLKLSWNISKKKLTFSYSDNETTYSSGRIVFDDSDSKDD